ncbi:MAG: PilZ domain-containing protein [Phycisphaerales bacterium]
MTDSGLIVRRSVRFEISLPGRMRVAPHHADALSFAKGVCGEDRWIDIDVIDFAEGGLGFMSEVFVPRRVDLEIEIPGFHPDDQNVLLRCVMRVHRVQMTDRRPAYKIGGAFVELDAETEAQVENLLNRLSNECDEEGDAHA